MEISRIWTLDKFATGKFREFRDRRGGSEDLYSQINFLQANISCSSVLNHAAEERSPMNLAFLGDSHHRNCEGQGNSVVQVLA